MALVLEDIKYFLHVAHTLNITRASEIAGVTQPTLSYSVKRLENELGGDLLIRLKNGVQLTKLGKDFLQKSSKLIIEWEGLKKITNNSSVGGKFTLGVHPSVGLYVLPCFLPKLIKESPDIEFHLAHALSREITEKVISWKLDFGIVVNPKKHPDLVIAELCQDRIGLFSTTKAKDMLIFDKELTQSNSIIKKMKLKFQHQTTTSNLEIIAKLTSIGYGTGILPERVAKQYKNLKLLDENLIYKDRICLVYRHERHKDISGQTIISHIKGGSY